MCPYSYTKSEVAYGERAAVHDRAAQTIQFQTIVIANEKLQLYPVYLRYAWPGEIDLMARLAGLELRNRWSGWDRSTFTAASTEHVSVYGRPVARRPTS